MVQDQMNFVLAYSEDSEIGEEGWTQSKLHFSIARVVQNLGISGLVSSWILTFCQTHKVTSGRWIPRMEPKGWWWRITIIWTLPLHDKTIEDTGMGHEDWWWWIEITSTRVKQDLRTLRWSRNVCHCKFAIRTKQVFIYLEGVKFWKGGWGAVNCWWLLFFTSSGSFHSNAAYLALC